MSFLCCNKSSSKRMCIVNWLFVTAFRFPGISGGSASGKTTVAEKIIQALDFPWVVLLSMDSFYKVSIVVLEFALSDLHVFFFTVLTCTRSIGLIMTQSLLFTQTYVLSQSFFFAETFRLFLLGHFGHWNISVICFTILLKLTITVFFSLYFQRFWPKWLNFFPSFQKRFDLWPKKNRSQ